MFPTKTNIRNQAEEVRISQRNAVLARETLKIKARETAVSPAGLSTAFVIGFGAARQMSSHKTNEKSRRKKTGLFTIPLLLLKYL